MHVSLPGNNWDVQLLKVVCNQSIIIMYILYKYSHMVYSLTLIRNVNCGSLILELCIGIKKVLRWHYYLFYRRYTRDENGSKSFRFQTCFRNRKQIWWGYPPEIGIVGNFLETKTFHIQLISFSLTYSRCSYFYWVLRWLVEWKYVFSTTVL